MKNVNQEKLNELFQEELTNSELQIFSGGESPNPLNALADAIILASLSIGSY